MNVPPNKPSVWGFMNLIIWMGTGVSFGEYREPGEIIQIEFDGSDSRVPCVYFLSAGRRVKIGHTQDIIDRVGDLQRMNSNTLRLIGVIPGGRELESQIHDKFSGIRLHGEWFIECPEIYKFINVATKEWTTHQS